MSLQIYLPFNGDIKNYGQLSVTTQSTGTITYENGIQYNQCGNLTSNAYIDILNAYEPITHWDDWSVAVWIYPVSKDSHSNTIINSGNWNAINTLWHFALRDYNSSTNTFTSVLVPNTNNWSTANITGLSIPINTWTHLVLTYNFTTKTQKLYINNVLAATYSTYDGTTHGKDTSSYPHLRLGANNYSTGMYSHAKMSDFRMYNHELSLKEINDLYTKAHLSQHGLQIWLPLNGNLNNYGLSNVNFTYTNATYVTGKLGKALYINNQASNIVTCNALKNTKQFSACCWVKLISGNTFTAYADVIAIYTKNNSSNATGWTRLECNTNANSMNWYSNTCLAPSSLSSVIPVTANDTWHHIALIFDGTKFIVYLDGIKHSTQNIASGYTDYSFDGRIKIGDSGMYCHLNDVRIYDYAISESELKKFIKCPILHYQLNQFDNYLIRTYHMSGGGTANGNTKTYLENNEIVQVVAASGNSNYVKFDHANEAFKLTNFLNAGDKFTISYDIKIVSANNKLPQVYATNNSGGYQSTTGDPTLVGEWQRVQCIKTQGSATDGGISVHIGFSGCVGTYLIRHLKLEPGEVTRTYWTPNLRDLEGNLHNGYGNPELKSSINTLAKFGQGNHKSPRYKSALLFGAHQTPYTAADLTEVKAALDHCTISWWEKVTITGNSLPFTGGSTSYYVAAGSTTTNLYDGTNSGANAWLYVDGIKETSPSGTTTRTHTNIKYEQNIWHHYCLVDVNMTNWTKFWIDNYSSGWPTQAYLSDLRIYNSLLTDTEVLELYKMGHMA